MDRQLRALVRGQPKARGWARDLTGSSKRLRLSLRHGLCCPSPPHTHPLALWKSKHVALLRCHCWAPGLLPQEPCSQRPQVCAWSAREAENNPGSGRHTCAAKPTSRKARPTPGLLAA